MTSNNESVEENIMLTNSWHHHHCESQLYHQDLLREAALRRLAGRRQTHASGVLLALIRAMRCGTLELFAGRRTIRMQRQ